MDLTGGHDEAGLIYSAADGTVVTSSCTDWSWDRISSRDNIFKYNNVSNVFDGSLANANYFGTYFVAPNGSSNVFTPSGYFMSNLHCSQLVLLVRFPTRATSQTSCCGHGRAVTQAEAPSKSR